MMKFLYSSNLKIILFFALFSIVGSANAEVPASPPTSKVQKKVPVKRQHSHHQHKKKTPLGWQPHVPNVVVTIKPVHSLVAGVMEGIAEPQLMIQDNSSPHVHAIKPSEATMLDKAEVIVWVSENYETFLKNRLENLEDRKVIINLSKAKQVKLYPLRTGGFWGTGTCQHTCRSCDTDDDKSEESCDCHHSSKDHHHHEPFSKDGHLWLAPNNAKAIVTQITEELAALDPQHASNYLANSKKVISRLNELAVEITEVVRPVKDTPYMMVHDFSQYFDRYFGTQGVGTILDASHSEPTAKFLRQVEGKLNSGSAKCLIVEPQFNSKITRMLIEDTKIPTQQVDYLGGDLDKGPDCYFEIMRRFANSLVNCLK